MASDLKYWPQLHREQKAIRCCILDDKRRAQSVAVFEIVVNFGGFDDFGFVCE
jgi:hypothetical protein